MPPNSYRGKEIQINWFHASHWPGISEQWYNILRTPCEAKPINVIRPLVYHQEHTLAHTGLWKEKQIGYMNIFILELKAPCVFQFMVTLLFFPYRNYSKDRFRCFTFVCLFITHSPFLPVVWRWRATGFSFRYFTARWRFMASLPFVSFSDIKAEHEGRLLECFKTENATRYLGLQSRATLVSANSLSVP